MLDGESLAVYNDTLISFSVRKPVAKVHFQHKNNKILLGQILYTQHLAQVGMLAYGCHRPKQNVLSYSKVCASVLCMNYI